MPDYRLTRAAEEDLFAIAAYGDRYFGVEQSDRYRDQLKERFNVIARYPTRYPIVTFLQVSYRRSVCGKHSIYYRVASYDVLIVRILRRQNPQNALNKIDMF